MGWELQQECTFASSAFNVQDFLQRCTGKVCFWFALATVGSQSTLSPAFPPHRGTSDDALGYKALDYTPPMAEWRKNPDVRCDFMRCQWAGVLPNAAAMFSFLLNVEMHPQTPLLDSRGVYYSRLQTHFACVALTSPKPDECRVQLYEGLAPIWFGLEQPVEDILLWGLSRLLNDTWNGWLLLWQKEQEAKQKGAEPPAESAGPAEAEAKAEDGQQLPTWLPKKEKTRQRWHNAYVHIKDRLEDLARQYDDGDSDEPEPTLADLGEHLTQEIHWRPSAKTVGRIRKAGEKGWV